MSEDRKTCFVIMPFSETTDEHTEEYWTDHFERFLKPLIEENPNLEARRSKPLRGDILNEIIKDLVTSPIVVANLTDRNANVYWELGVRQSFKHGTITITEGKETDLPFDVSGKGTLKYHPTDYIQNEQFRKDFKEAIEDCLQNPDRPDSQVLETLSGRGTLFEILHRDEVIRLLDALLSEINKNFIKLNKIIEQSKKNQEDPNHLKYIAYRLNSFSTQLLITNRYVNEDPSFFDMAEEYSDNIIKINEQLCNWPYQHDTTEKYFLKVFKIFERKFNDFKEKIENVRNDMSLRL